jgi:hypothetical protein
MPASKPHAARQASRAFADSYPGLPGDVPIPPPMDRPPRAGYAWDRHGDEVRLLRGRRWPRAVEKDEDGE